MSKRAFSRAFDMPTIDPDKEDESTENIRVIKYKGPPPVLEPTKINKKYVDELINSLERSIESSLGIGPAVRCPVAAQNSCDHEWKDYLGLSEQFTYCVHCDEKRR